jgi:putative membrane protein
MGFDHGGPYGDHGWWVFFGGFLPLVLFLVLIGLGVWAVLRFTGRGRALMPASTGATAASPPDDALHEVRLRYARGEMDREEFVQRYRDLGGIQPPSDEPSPPSVA